MHTAEYLVSPGIAGQVADGSFMEMRYDFRLDKDTAGYYVYSFLNGMDGGWGLETAAEEAYKLSDKEEYYFYLPGEYDTSDMYKFCQITGRGDEGTVIRQCWESDIRTLRKRFMMASRPCSWMIPVCCFSCMTGSRRTACITVTGW